MPQLDFAGIPVVYERVGQGPPIVLLHGFTQDARAWRPQLDGLRDVGTLVAWDAPGAGRSGDPPEDWAIVDWCRALVCVLDDAGIDTALVVGLSWGGLLAQELFRLEPARVRGLVLADTYAGWAGSLGERAANERLAACIEDSQLPPRAFVAKYLLAMFGNAPNPKVMEELGSIMADFHPSGFRGMARSLARSDTRSLLPTIGVPTRLVWGSDDKRSPLAVGHAMRTSIPRANVTILRGAGHMSNLEAPDEFNRVVRDFSASLDGP